MGVKLNSDMTEYILCGSKQQLNKASHEPFRVRLDLIELNNKFKYLRGFLDNTLNFESYVSLKVQNAMINFIKIRYICKCITREACTTLVLMFHITLGLLSCSTLWAAKQNLQKIPNYTEHLCQTSTG